MASSRELLRVAANVKLHGARPWHLSVVRLNSQRPSTELIKNLFIADGSVITGALAANPTMTTTAQEVKPVIAALQ